MTMTRETTMHPTASAVLLLSYRVHSAWLVLGGAAVGLLRTLLPLAG